MHRRLFATGAVREEARRAADWPLGLGGGVPDPRPDRSGGHGDCGRVGRPGGGGAAKVAGPCRAGRRRPEARRTPICSRIPECASGCRSRPSGCIRGRWRWLSGLPRVGRSNPEPDGNRLSAFLRPQNATAETWPGIFMRPSFRTGRSRSGGSICSRQWPRCSSPNT